MSIGLNLPRLAEQPGLQSQPERFLQKLGSLVRLALSAATQKRDFLRRHGQVRPALLRGFLLDRARLVLVPVGLEAVVRRLIGQGLGDNDEGLEFGRQIVARLHEALRQESRHRYLDSTLDSADRFCLGKLPPSAEQTAGLTLWDAETPPREQVRRGATLQADAKSGTTAILLASGQTLSPDSVAELLRFAWQQTEITRLRFVRLLQSPRQVPGLWQE
jgi:hypothetical protein